MPAGGGQGPPPGARVVSFHLIRLHIVQSADTAGNCKRGPGDTHLESWSEGFSNFLNIDTLPTNFMNEVT